MKDAKFVMSPLVGHHTQCPTIKKEKQEIIKVSYQSSMGNLMHAMMCTRPDNAYVVGVVSLLMRKSSIKSSEVDTRVSQRNFYIMSMLWKW